MNSGYNGYSMSLNACYAYESGEKPISKWVKGEIVEAIEKLNKDIDINLLKKINSNKLKCLCLRNSSYHHTSKFCNTTDFYSIDEERIERLTNDKLMSIIENQKKEEKTKTEWYYARIVYEEWSGSRKWGKYVRREETGIVVNNWFHSRFNKKNINGVHILHIDNKGTRKPREFDTSDMKYLKNKLLKGVN